MDALATLLPTGRARARPGEEGGAPRPTTRRARAPGGASARRGATCWTTCPARSTRTSEPSSSSPTSAFTLDNLIALYEAEERRGAARRPVPPARRAVRRGRQRPQVPAARRRGDPLRERGSRTGARRSQALDRRARGPSRRHGVTEAPRRSLHRTSACGRSSSRTSGCRRRRRRRRGRATRAQEAHRRAPRGRAAGPRASPRGVPRGARERLRRGGRRGDPQARRDARRAARRRGRRAGAGAARGGTLRAISPTCSSCGCARRPSRRTGRRPCARSRRRPRSTLGDATARRVGAPPRPRRGAARRRRCMRTIERLAERRSARTAGSGTPTPSRSAPAHIFDAHVTADLFVRLGRVAEEKLGRRARGARPTSTAVERTGDEPGVARGARPPLRAAGRRARPRRRPRAADRGRGRRGEAGGALAPLASLQIDEFEREGARGSRPSGRRSSGCPSHAASREASRSSSTTTRSSTRPSTPSSWSTQTLGQTEELATLYERRSAAPDGARSRSGAPRPRASVLEEQVKDAARAQRVIEEALGEDPSDDDALAELERLAPTNGGWKEASSRRSSRRSTRRRTSRRGRARSYGCVWRAGAATKPTTLGAPRRPSATRSSSIPRTSTSSARSRTSVARRGASAISSRRCGRAPSSKESRAPSVRSAAGGQGARRGHLRRRERSPSSAARSPRRGRGGRVGARGADEAPRGGGRSGRRW